MDSFNKAWETSDLQIPKRRNAERGGTKGRATEIYVNHIPLDLDELFKKTVYLMEVSITPAQPKNLLRLALDEFCYKHYPNVKLAFDGWRNIYTTQHLTEKQDTINILDKETHQTVDFHIVVSVANAIEMNKIQEYIARGSSIFPPHDAVQTLKMILKNIPYILKIKNIGQLFFPPQNVNPINIGDGLELRKGFSQQVLIGWKPYLVINETTKPFIKTQNLITYIQKDLNCDVNSQLDQKNVNALSNFVTDLKVHYIIPNQPDKKKTYYINGLLENASQFNFVNNADNNMINVIDYYKQYHNYSIKYPNLPCLHAGNEKKIALPMEMCIIQKGQLPFKKINGYQQKLISKNSNQPPVQQQQWIEKFISDANYKEGPILKEFGINITDKLATIPARILDQPTLAYAENKILTPSSGVWKPEKLWKAVQIKRWIILNLDNHTSIPDLKEFETSLITSGKLINVEVNQMYPTFNCFLQKPWSLADMELKVTQFFNKKKNTVDLIVVVIPESSTGLYQAIKQSSELVVGVLTQCVKSKTLQMMKLRPKLKMTTAHNLLLKMNTKLNGVNHILAVQSSQCVMKGAIFIGASTNHPPSGSVNSPSIAVVTANHDINGSQYNMEWSFQQPNVSIIQELENMVYNQLVKSISITGYAPIKIFYFRDAVAQSVFGQLLDHELIAIRRACLLTNITYKPAMTFMVVQKKHHTRMFPKHNVDMEGKAFNVPVGTVVDTQITHPTEFDFYLCSHNNAQGTTNPTKYHRIWDDSNFTEDQLEQLMFHLCYMHARSTNSVSYPIPIYYSHLGALRTRTYIKNEQINLNRLSEEQAKYKRNYSLMDNNPMHFI